MRNTFGFSIVSYVHINRISTVCYSKINLIWLTVFIGTSRQINLKWFSKNIQLPVFWWKP